MLDRHAMLRNLGIFRKSVFRIFGFSKKPEAPSKYRFPIPTPAPDWGGPVACFGGLVAKNNHGKQPWKRTGRATGTESGLSNECLLNFCKQVRCSSIRTQDHCHS